MNKLLIIFLFIPLLFINIPPYIELNNLAIIEEIGIKHNKENYTLYLKEIIPIKEDNSIEYEYKYYESTNKNIKSCLKEISKTTKKTIYLNKVKTIYTNKNINIKKELGIKPNSIKLTNKDIKSILKN